MIEDVFVYCCMSLIYIGLSVLLDNNGPTERFSGKFHAYFATSRGVRC